MSDDEEEEMDTFGSSSLTEESSSDEYTPYARKGTRTRTRKGGQRRRKVHVTGNQGRREINGARSQLC